MRGGMAHRIGGNSIKETTYTLAPIYCKKNFSKFENKVQKRGRMKDFLVSQKKKLKCD
jgi:hypothetical protein